MPFSTNNIQPDFQTPLSYLYVGVTQANTGFTPIVPSVDTVTWYCSTSGNDANDGLSEITPKRYPSTVQALLRDGFADHIRFRCGDVFDAADEIGSVNLLPPVFGRSSLEPIVYHWYGDESLNRPEFTGYGMEGGQTPGVINTNFQGLKIGDRLKDPQVIGFSVSISVKNATYADGNLYEIVATGTDSVELTASYTSVNGDDFNSVADDLAAQLSALVGVSVSREGNSGNAKIIITKTLAGIFYVSRLNDFGLMSGSIVAAGCSMKNNNVNVLFEDCYMNMMSLNINNGSNLKIRRCILNKEYSLFTDQGVKAASNFHVVEINGVEIVECVADYGGWHPTYPTCTTNQYAHAYYIQYNCTNDVQFLRNITTRPASHGVHCRPGGLVEDCFFGRCPVGAQVFYNDSKTAVAGEIGYIRNCVISDVISMVQGVSDDITVIQSTGAQWGLVSADDTWSDQGDVQFIGNIVARRTDSSIDNQWPIRYPSSSLGYQSGTEFMDPGRIEDFTPHVVRADNIAWRFDETNQGDEFGYVDPDRGLPEWYSLSVSSGEMGQLVADGVTIAPVGPDFYENAVAPFINRKLNRWSPLLTAPAVNAFIRVGYTI